MYTIENILAARHAFLKGKGGDKQLAQGRRDLTMAIEHNYPAFEIMRDDLVDQPPARKKPSAARPPDPVDFNFLFDSMLSHQLIHRNDDQFLLKDVNARRFMTGGWLEELAWLAAVEAGADEAYYSQLVGWDVDGYSGENEIDVIFRKGERLGFVSCKALRSSLASSDRKHRARMMDAVHEADNLADHFGEPGERVGVLVTTDLFDEDSGSARYEALMGKAAVLDVRVIPLEDIGWNRLVDVMQYLMDT